MLFENIDRGQLAAIGEVRRPSIADLFVAVMSPPSLKATARQTEIGDQTSGREAR
jgi:hypothetical protein